MPQLSPPQLSFSYKETFAHPSLCWGQSCFLSARWVMMHHDKHAKLWKIAVGDNSCVTTCKGKSGNLELCYNTPNDTLAKFT